MAENKSGHVTDLVAFESKVYLVIERQAQNTWGQAQKLLRTTGGWALTLISWASQLPPALR